MAKQVLNVDNSDNSGGDESVTLNTVSTLEQDSTLIHYYNNWDQSVTVTIDGSRAGDDTFSESVELASESVSAGGNAGYYVVSEPWEQVEVVATPAADPTSGAFTVHRMDDN